MYFIKRTVISHQLKTASDLEVWTSRGSSFHCPGTITERSLDACFPCTLRDGWSTQAVLEDQKECVAVQGVICVLMWVGAGTFSSL